MLTQLIKGEFINPCGARGVRALPAPLAAEFLGNPHGDLNCACKERFPMCILNIFAISSGW